MERVETQLVGERAQVLDHHVARETVTHIPLRAGVASRVDEVEPECFAEQRPLRGPVLERPRTWRRGA